MVRGALVAFEGEDVFGVGFLDFSGDAALAAHGVEGDDAAGEFECAQQFGDCGDFVAFVVHTALAEDESIARSPSVDDDFWAFSGVDGTAQRLAVDSHSRAQRDRLPQAARRVSAANQFRRPARCAGFGSSA